MAAGAGLDDHIFDCRLGDRQRGISLLAGALGGESSPVGLAVGMGSPFLAVNLLATAMIHTSSGLQPRLPGLCCGALLYALVAAWLFKRAWMSGKADNFAIYSPACDS